jgi:uncharacterized protein YbjT (DUF2867 family)
MVLGGAITLPATDVPAPFIDIDDIADVAVAALVEDGHHGEIYEVTGPRMLTFGQAAAEISGAAVREVVFVPLAKESFMAGATDSGVPADIAWLLNYLFETVLDGRNAFLPDGVQRALGRAPKDFTVFAEEVARAGKWRIQQELSA